MKEIWKDIQGYEGLYKISNSGKILSVRNGNIKKACLGKRGYYCIDLWRNNSRKNFKIHRLLAKYFISNPNNFDIVNHINGIKTDNRIENLEWCTISDNVIHAIKNGMKRDVGENSMHSKLTVNDVIDIRMNNTETHISLSKKYNVSRSLITAIKGGKRWKDYGN